MLRAIIALLAFGLTVSFGVSQVPPQSHNEVGNLSITEAQRHVRTIEICTGWGGLGTPQKNIVTIQRKGNEFISDGEVVSIDQVQALLTALSQPPITQPEMANLGITPTWRKMSTKD